MIVLQILLTFFPCLVLLLVVADLFDPRRLTDE